MIKEGKALDLIIMKCFQIALEGSIVLLVVLMLRFLLRKVPKKCIYVSTIEIL